jgi:hypothetical protein
MYKNLILLALEPDPFSNIRIRNTEYKSEEKI